MSSLLRREGRRGGGWDPWIDAVQVQKREEGSDKGGRRRSMGMRRRRRRRGGTCIVPMFIKVGEAIVVMFVAMAEGGGGIGEDNGDGEEEGLDN